MKNKLAAIQKLKSKIKSSGKEDEGSPSLLIALLKKNKKKKKKNKKDSVEDLALPQEVTGGE